MKRAERVLDRWKADYDYKTVAAASASLAVTAIFALYNGFLGVYYASLWHGTICVYYLVLAILRAVVVSAGKRAARKADPARAQEKAYAASAALLIFLNLCLVVPVSLMVTRQKPVHMSLIPAIAMAAYTTYKVIMVSVNLKRRKKSARSLIRLLRAISFVDALVSILTLQNTLIMVTVKDESAEMLTLSAITSAAIMLAVLAVSAAAMRKGVAGLREKNGLPVRAGQSDRDDGQTDGGFFR